jgi:anti-anti-sigma factor
MQKVPVCPKPMVIQLQGSLNAANVDRLRQQLQAGVLSEQHASLLIDMHQVELMDSAALMVLVSAHRLAQRLNKPFVLCSLSRSVQMIFELTQLDQVFKILELSTPLDLAA